MRHAVSGVNTMDNIRNVLKILFRYTSPAEVLDVNNDYPYVDKNSFLTLGTAYMPQYSSNEIENMYHFLCSEFEWHNNKMRGKVIIQNGRKVNVFDAILLFVDNVLVEENGKPLCCYEHLLRWREMTVELDEDLFVTAFFAQKDIFTAAKHRKFFWAPVIGHNNKSLNRLMEQGVAENHFHLKGSAPLFHLSWCSMMMNVCRVSFREIFNSYDDNRLHMNVLYRAKYADTSFYISYLQAALIRLYLFACLMQEPFLLQEEYIEYGRIAHYLKEDKRKEKTSQREKKVRLTDYRDQFQGDQKEYDWIIWGLLRREVEELLSDEQELLFHLRDIQNKIEYMQAKYAENQLDYTICLRHLSQNPDRRLNEVISGERWFLYEVFKKIYSGEPDFMPNGRLFYAYLLIKENIRAEMIQVNHNVGFQNFLKYQDRKESFIEGTPFEAVYLRMAVRDTILNQHIKKLEARITPKETAQRLANAIRKNDNTILALEKGDERQKLEKKYFYVCHFIKEPDERLIGLEEQEHQLNFEPYYRHYELRKKVMCQAHAVLEFRCQNEILGGRIRGIDASSEEIGCRPEVFAQAFRFLRNRAVSHIDYMTGVVRQMPDLCITYHVGEDFLDLIDGLRAIDEAVSFLNMRCGDRLGHALALGIDVEEWYASKSGRILITQMDYLDNLVWIYSIIRKYRIDDCEDALHFIEKRYDEYFRIIYLNNMDEKYYEMVVEDAGNYCQDRNIQNMYGNTTCLFPINTYYDSWKLRGDNPEYFKKGYFNLEAGRRTEWDEFGINKQFPENYRIRYNPEAAYLYHIYHYNPRVKREGNKCAEIKVNLSIINAVKKVQTKLQWVIAQKGIGIETNPSSNALIGTFKRYDKHPIVNWYNNGLVTDHQLLSEAAQIQVSINTDDQGVFATYIENEYAYLALALEKMRDKNGNPKYSRTIIYEWIDNIRKMGLSQSFAQEEEEIPYDFQKELDQLHQTP